MPEGNVSIAEISCPVCGLKQKTERTYVHICRNALCHAVIRLPERRKEKPVAEVIRKRRGGVGQYSGSCLPEQCGGGFMSPKPGI